MISSCDTRMLTSIAFSRSQLSGKQSLCDILLYRMQWTVHPGTRQQCHTARKSKANGNSPKLKPLIVGNILPSLRAIIAPNPHTLPLMLHLSLKSLFRLLNLWRCHDRKAYRSFRRPIRHIRQIGKFGKFPQCVFAFEIGKRARTVEEI